VQLLELGGAIAPIATPGYMLASGGMLKFFNLV